MILLLALSALPALPLIVPQDDWELGKGIPHPTRAVYFHLSEEVDENGFAVGEHNECWWSIHPSWLNEEIGVSTLEESVRHVASSRGLTEAQIQQTLEQVDMNLGSIFYSLSQGEKVLMDGELNFKPGSPQSTSYSSASTVLSDFDVEIAQGSSIMQPIVKFQWEGCSIALRAFPVVGMGWLCELAVAQSKESEPRPDIKVDHGFIVSKSRNPVEVYESQSWMLLPFDETRSVRFGDEPTSLISLNLTAPPAPNPNGASNGIIALPLHALALRPGWQALIEMETGFPWCGEDGWTVFCEEDSANAKHALNVLQSAFEAKQVGIKLSSMTESGWAPIAQWSGSTLMGHSAHFAMGGAFDILRDWDVEVACSSRIPDPNFRTVFSGVRGKATPVVSAGQLSLDLDLKMRGFSLNGYEAVTFAQAQPAMIGHEGPTPGLPLLDGFIDKVKMQEMTIQGVFAMGEDGTFRQERTTPHGKLLLELDLAH